MLQRSLLILGVGSKYVEETLKKISAWDLRHFLDSKLMLYRSLQILGASRRNYYYSRRFRESMRSTSSLSYECCANSGPPSWLLGLFIRINVRTHSIIQFTYDYFWLSYSENILCILGITKVILRNFLLQRRKTRIKIQQ